jgi:predicted RNA binding protein YcfA (HicA-like mRNA interferase family)
MNKDTKRLFKSLEEQGFEVTQTRNGHYRIRKDGRWVAIMAGTPSDRRAWLNAIAQLRRAGFQWKR